MKKKRLFAALSAGALLAGPATVFAQIYEPPPPPPSDFVCNGVTCEGWIVVGYDIDGNPILGYVVLPDINSEAPAPL
uniref:hypothetical protein n=1 Tax=Parerythrobacter lutipelagi TaxID=1964208 RepID=UPI0010F7286E|nr:hypothetical protein [Parerythrobacter lutipelagi]